MAMEFRFLLHVSTIVVLKFLLFSAQLVPISSRAIQVERLPQIPTFLTTNLASLASFKGLSGKTYFLNESYTDEEVVKIGECPERFILNDTESYAFKCKVIRPIIDANVYLETTIQGWSSPSRFFTGGRKLPDNERRPDSNDSLFWTEEYEFEIELSIQMLGIKCVGMDVYNNGTWRRSRRRIDFVHGDRPAVIELAPDDDGHRLFTVGKSAKLDCPMYYGVPKAKFTWNLPSGKTQNGSDRLYIKTVQHSDGGQYTCVAENKYGNSSYTFTVRLHDPSLLEIITTKWRSFLDLLQMIGFLLFYRAI